METVRRPITKTVLAIGGLDPTGGAGILIDQVACRAGGAHGAAIIATSTVQNGEQFFSAAAHSAAEIGRTARAVLETLEVGAIKTGALGRAEQVIAVARLAADHPSLPLVIDPVLHSTSGGELLDSDGRRALLDHLLPLAALVTPNLAEASALSRIEATDVETMRQSAVRLIDRGARAVLIKGGHLIAGDPTDLFYDHRGNAQLFSSKRQAVGEIRGTGCALASLIAAGLARGEPLVQAIERARAILQTAIANAYPVGSGPRVLSFR